MRIIAKRHKPLIVHGELIISYHKNKICSMNLEKGQVKNICTLRLKPIGKILSKTRFFERLLRYEVKAAVELSDTNILVSRLGAIYNINLENGKIVKEHTFRKNMNNPYSFTKIAGMKGFTDCILYGEYIGKTNERFSVEIYARDSRTAEWRKKYSFPIGKIRHIHNIVPDYCNNCVYILTGDLDNESGIWVTEDDFNTVLPLLVGSQEYRSVELFPINKNIFVYATDTALKDNYIMVCKRIADKTVSVAKVAELSGSCLSGMSDGVRGFFSTTVENDERIMGWRSWIDYHRSPGIKSEYAKLISLEFSDLSIKKVIEMKKDFWPCRLMQYGYFVICNVAKLESVIVYPIAVKKYDAKLLLLEKGIDY